ncbi:hypothetical protein BDM02DRAFT_3120145 [Thelephora ganbajun]|uniref:Uncharacterized protein n=1 Tax=Thelephora ganbajun TaxID=370292 RepID=A0ACB6Z750_THEGA|nr:hypothetical protein BDM02DRAFT_3120145 [Thelephora ganbajun]
MRGSTLPFSNRTSITSQNTVGYPNLSKEIGKYIAAYCTNPPKDDDCPFNFCPNPEIAGPLARIANYITGFCLAVLIFYSPRRVQGTF